MWLPCGRDGDDLEVPVDVKGVSNEGLARVRSHLETAKEGLHPNGPDCLRCRKVWEKLPEAERRVWED